MAYDMASLMAMLGGGKVGPGATLGTRESLAPTGGRTMPGGTPDPMMPPTLAGGGGPPEKFTPDRVQGGGFWEWLGKMGMPPQMQAMIRQDPNLMAQYFEQYRMQMAATEGGKAEQPGAPGQSASGGDSGGGAPTKKRGPRDPLRPGDIGYIRDGGTDVAGFRPMDSGPGSPMGTPWWNPATGR